MAKKMFGVKKVKLPKLGKVAKPKKLKSILDLPKKMQLGVDDDNLKPMPMPKKVRKAV